MESVKNTTQALWRAAARRPATCVLYWGGFAKMTAVIDHLFLKTGHGEPMQAVDQLVAERNHGLVGDLQYGGRRRQVLLIDSETLDEFSLAPGDVRENLTSRGLDPSTLDLGARLRIGGAVLEIIGDCAPCDQMEQLKPGLRQAIDGRRGLLARVLESGTLRIGDQIELQPASVRSQAVAATNTD